MKRTADPQPSPPPRVPPWLAAVLVAAAFFVAIAPTLPWLEFAGGSENLVVETVLEMRRGGPWFIPTLQGYPRLTKPPLTAWMTAAAARPQTVERLSTPDRGVREEAFRAFAWQVRWPTLLSACAMLLAAYALGDTLFGRPAGLVAALACGSSLFFLRFCRGATTDVQLALWVTVTNAFLALAVLRRRHWLGFVGAGVALGLAFMSKGPVAFVQSALPFAVFLLWRGSRWAADGTPADHRSGGRWALAAGAVLMLAVGLPWYAVVMSKHRGILGHWVTEVTREGATQLARDPWYTYLVFLPYMVPWLAFLVAGVWMAALSLRRRLDVSAGGERRREGFVLSLLLVVVPIATMSFFKDKNERYLLPMAAPAAVLAAGALAAWYRSDRRDPAGRVVEAFHWATLLVLAAGLPVLGLLAPRFERGEPWFTPLTAGAFGAASLLVVAAGFVLTMRAARGGGMAPGAGTAAFTAAAVMLLLQYPFIRGYSRAAVSDLKPLADAVWARHPDALIYEYEPGTRTRTYLDLPIYAGRLTRKVNDPLSLAQGERPQVVVYFERRRDGSPPPPPPWQELAAGGGRKDHWRAYVLPAKP